MKLLLAVLSTIVLYVQSTEIDFGPFDGHAEIGDDLPPKYVPLSNKDQRASANARVFAELLRREFPYGLDHNMPPLDPYKSAKMAPIVLQGKDTYPLNGTVTLTHLVKTGAQKFILNGLEVRLQGNRTDFNVSIPLLHIEVDFDAKLQISELPIEKKGHAILEVHGANVVGAVGAMALQPIGADSPFFKVNAMVVDLHADDVKYTLLEQNPNNRRSDSDPMNKYINALEDHMAMAIAQSSLDLTNDVLSKYTVNQILALLDVV